MYIHVSVLDESLKSQVCVCIGEAQHSEAYGVALLSRIDRIIALFCKRAL